MAGIIIGRPLLFGGLGKCFPFLLKKEFSPDFSVIVGKLCCILLLPMPFLSIPWPKLFPVELSYYVLTLVLNSSVLAPLCSLL